MEMTQDGKVSRNGRSLLSSLERYIRLEVVEKLTVATTFLVVAGVIFALATSSVFFLSNGLVKSLSELLGNESVAYYVVGGFLALLILIFYLNRKKWVEDKVVRSLSKSMLEQSFIEDSPKKTLAEELADELQDEI